MSKRYKGYELVKMIHDNVMLKDGTKIEVHDERLNPSLITVLEYKDYRLNWEKESFNTRALFDDYYYFMVLEDNTEEIEELGECSDLILMSENERVLFNMIKVTTHKVDEIIRKLNKLNTNKD